jgi:hypothetical protein
MENKRLSNSFVVISRRRGFDGFMAQAAEARVVCGAGSEAESRRLAEKLAMDDSGDHEYLACKIVSISAKPMQVPPLTVNVLHLINSAE